MLQLGQLAKHSHVPAAVRLNCAGQEMHCEAAVPLHARHDGAHKPHENPPLIDGMTK